MLTRKLPLPLKQVDVSETCGEKAKLTQAELGARLSMSQERLSVLENGRGRDGPSFGLMNRIAAACGFKWQLTPASPEMSVTETTARDAGRHRAGFFLGGVYAHFKSQDAAHAHIPVRGPRGRVVGDVTAVNVTLFSGQEEMIPAETFASGATRPPPDIPLMVFDSGGCVVGNVKAVNVVSASGHEEELSADFLCFDLHEKVFVATAKPRTGNISLHSDNSIKLKF